MRARADTVEGYLEELPAERRQQLKRVRREILDNLPPGYEEVVNWGMITYQIPIKRYPNTYNRQPLMFAALASQKNHMAVYLTNVYGDPKIKKWFEAEYKKSGKKLDMGKSCVRFKDISDLPLELIGQTIARTPVEDLIYYYEVSRHGSKGK